MMLSDKDLTKVENHFEFGDNWTSFSRSVDEHKVDASARALLALFTPEQLHGKSFADLGCGSGLHSAAAARLGVTRVFAIDLDPACITAATEVFHQHAPVTDATFETLSVFDLDPSKHGSFDVVYSWGVLHHTGDLRVALRRAASIVAQGGLIAMALYRPTALDRFWIWEKRWYHRANRFAQRFARGLYTAVFVSTRVARGRFGQLTSGRRGMEYWHDLHDWLGGYPYEPISSSQVDEILRGLGFEAVRVPVTSHQLGLLGSGCDEFVYRRIE